MLIQNAYLFPMNQAPIASGYVQVTGGKIQAVGSMTDLVLPEEEEVMDAKGAYLLPGFIDAHCHLGLFESGGGFEGADGNESTGPVSPELRVIDAINPRDRYFGEALENGVTTAVVTPGSANVIGGQIAAIQTGGDRIDSMILHPYVGMKMALGENPKTVYHRKGERPMTRMGEVALIRDTLFKAREYWRLKGIGKSPPFHMGYEALGSVLSRQAKIHVHAHRADDIFTALRLAEEFQLRLVLVHCTEGYLTGNALSGAEVVVGPVMTDRSKPELRNASPRNAALLRERGAKVAICSDHPENPIPYLSVLAGICVREGMDEMEALRALTIVPAAICGIDDRVGSIEVGKDADFLLFRNSPFSLTAKPNAVFLKGTRVVSAEKKRNPSN